MPISKKSLITAIDKAYENADELITESEILFKSKAYARAVVLAHLGSEELGKVLLCVHALLDVISSRTISRDKYFARYRSHLKKIEWISKFDAVSTNIDTDHDDSDLGKQWKALVRNHAFYNDLKNNSLYSSFNEGRYSKPSEIINKEIAEGLLLLSKARRDAILNFKDYTLGLLKKMESISTSNPDFEKLEKVFVQTYQELHSWLKD